MNNAAAGPQVETDDAGYTIFHQHEKGWANSGFNRADDTMKVRVVSDGEVQLSYKREEYKGASDRRYTSFGNMSGPQEFGLALAKAAAPSVFAQRDELAAALREIVGLLDGDVDEATIAEARNVAAKLLNGGLVPTRAERAALAKVQP